VSTQVAPPGLRERKKQATRQSIIDTAWALFEKQGYATTTIDDIAEVADVSPRTIFRYFASKEALLFARADDMIAALEAELASRPADEPLLESLRHGVRRTCGFAADDAERNRAVTDIIRSEPALREYQQQVVGQRIEQAMVGFVARRLGADPERDMRPHVLGAAVKGALMAAVHFTFGFTPGDAASGPRPGEIDRELLMATVDQAFAALARGFA
jgi:AcrR family transcriptional regulator